MKENQKKVPDSYLRGFPKRNFGRISDFPSVNRSFLKERNFFKTLTVFEEMGHSGLLCVK